MLYTISLAGLVLALSTSPQAQIDQSAVLAKIDKVVSVSACDTRFAITKTFAGGQYVVHITRATTGMRGFMDVQAGDLLASYDFDKDGNLVDQAVWVSRRRNVSPKTFS